jgi:flagellar basal body-associated protein FliL
VKDVQTNPGQKRQLQWIMAIMLLLLVVVVVVGVSVFFVTRGKDNKQVMGTEASSPPSDAPSGDRSASPSFSPVPVDPLVEEMRSWIAPSREDLMKFLDPASPKPWFGFKMTQLL